MEKIYLIPGKGLVIIDPLTKKSLPEEGALISMTTYWQRRINHGDVTIGKPPASAPAKPAAKTTTNGG